MTDVNVTRCGLPSVITHEFSYPGDYRVCVDGGECSIVRNRYVHRDLLDLTDDERAEFARALNTMRFVRTQAGRLIYGDQCLGARTDYYTHDAFVALHTMLSLDPRGDRLHYGIVQEPAHMAWTSYMQRAMRCICRSCSHVYVDPVRDLNGTLTDALSSRVWDFYGGASAYHSNNEDDPMYVADGKLPYWPLTSTKDPDYWCEPLGEMIGPGLEANCRDVLTRHAWKFARGLTLMQPKPDSALDFVSRRPFYWLGDDAHCVGRVDALRALGEQRLSTIRALWDKVSSVVHSWGHNCVSGKWTASNVTIAPGASMLALGNDKAINVLNVESESGHPCLQCTDTECVCTVATAAECAPTPWFDMTPDASHTYRTYVRARDQSLPALINAGCNWPRSGTFDWSPSANQDPMFYALHWYTFMANERGHRQLKEDTGKSVLELLESYGAFVNNERPGLGLYDATEFTDFVPYRAEQTRGTKHTWYDIIEYFTSETDFVFDL